MGSYSLQFYSSGQVCPGAESSFWVSSEWSGGLRILTNDVPSPWILQNNVSNLTLVDTLISALKEEWLEKQSKFGAILGVVELVVEPPFELKNHIFKEKFDISGLHTNLE